MSEPVRDEPSARITGPRRISGPTARLATDAVINDRLSLTFRGPLPKLLDWLANQPLDDLKIEPQGLGPIYRTLHG